MISIFGKNISKFNNKIRIMLLIGSQNTITIVHSIKCFWTK